MTAKEYFMHIAQVAQSRRYLARTIEELRTESSAIGGFDYAKPVVQTSPHNTLEDKAIRLVEAIDEYEKVSVQYAKEILEAEERVAQLSRPIYSRVIRLRYFNGMHSWGWVADELGYSEIQAKRLLYSACAEFEDKFLQK